MSDESVEPGYCKNCGLSILDHWIEGLAKEPNERGCECSDEDIIRQHGGSLTDLLTKSQEKS